MSAFVVSKSHIDALIQAGREANWSGSLRWYHDGHTRKLELENASEVGRMLWAENVTSVEYRYPDCAESGDLPGGLVEVKLAPELEPVPMPEYIGGYKYVPTGKPSLEPVAVLKAIDCYEYQSCEHDGWETSEARAFCEALRSRMIGNLPGYEEAEWEVSCAA